jgi:hypothetical protein
LGILRLIQAQAQEISRFSQPQTGFSLQTTDNGLVTRNLLYALLGLIGLGVVISLLPAPQSPAKAEVRLSGVQLELYPAADPDAKWEFRAKDVVYNPETRESVVDLVGVGKRILGSTTDLELKTDQITIDSSDNLRTNQARIFIPKGCYFLRLSSSGSNMVFIDQNAGYRAPNVDVDSENLNAIGTDFSANFDMTNTNAYFEFKAADKAIKKCEEVQVAFLK